MALPGSTLAGKRKLLFLSTAAGSGQDARHGGGEHFASEFIQAISLKGWKVSLVCPTRSSLRRDGPLVGSLESELTLDLSLKVDRPGQFIWTMAKWLWEARLFKGAILYANGYEAMKWAVPAGKLWGIPVVCHLHESTYGPYRSRRARMLAPFVDRFFAISNEVRRQFMEGTGIDQDKVSIVYNGVLVANQVAKSVDERQSVRKEFGFSEDANLIVMAARTDVHKGHEIFVNAASDLHRSHPQAAFLMVGLQRNTSEESALFDRVTDNIQKNSMDGVVVHTGYRDDVRRLMRAADVVVVPSTSEGFGRTAIEAMAEKTAVVASKVGGLAEIITDGEDGIHFPPGDSKALAKALATLIENNVLRTRIADAGYRSAQDRFSLDSMRNLIETHLLAVLGHRA